MTAVSRRINQIARDLKHGDDPRTLDQIRADVFLDLLAGVDLNTAGRRATVDITVDLETLTGLTENPGELAGIGPVIADRSPPNRKRRNGGGRSPTPTPAGWSTPASPPGDPPPP